MAFKSRSKAFAFILFLAVLFTVVLMGLQGIYTSTTGRSAWGAYFYSADAWGSVRDFVLNSREVEGFSLWQGYYAYFIIEMLFIPVYAIFFYRVANRLRQGKYLTFALIAILCITDVVENIYLMQLQNTPRLSGVKFFVLFIIAGIVINHYIARLSDIVFSFLFTLWYCRLSVIMLILMLVLMNNPQGKDLLIYMFEGDCAVVPIVLFNAVTFLAGVTIWYAPRFLYPENPIDSKGYNWKSMFVYSEWIGHFNRASYEVETGHEKTKQRGNVEQQCARIAVAAVPKVRAGVKTDEVALNTALSDTDQNPERDNIAYLMMLRRYLPIVLSLAFFAMVLWCFWNVTSNLLSENNIQSTWFQSFFKFVMYSILALTLCAFAFPQFRADLAATLKIWFSGRAIDWIIIALFVVGISLLLFGVRDPEQLNTAVLSGQVLCLVAQFLTILSVTHSKARDSWLNRHKPVLHVVILISLISLAVFYVLYLLYLSLDFSMGLSVAIVAGLAYYAIYLIFSYKGNDPSKKTYYASSLLVVVLTAFVVSTSIDNNHLDVALLPNKRPGRENLDLFTKQFMSQFEDVAKSEEKVPVYFIAANGGGTMQAYWTAATLSYLRQQTQDTIRQHIFAMSGASGGAVGLGLTTLAWDIPYQEVWDRLDTFYNADYLSGGLAYMFSSDLILSAVPLNLKGWPNRNSWLYDMYSRSVAQHLSQNNDHNLWEMPFDSIWLMDRGKGWRPLYFANTTLVEKGERGVCAPVVFSPENTTGVDILSTLRKKYSSTLSFGNAVLLTERFPYVNTSGKIEEFGHFADGGYYDNSGMETLMEVYRMVEDEMFHDSSKFKPVFVHINFGTEGWQRYGVDTTYGLCPIDAISEQSEFALPLFTAYNTILGESVYNAVEIVNQFGIELHRLYLPGPEVYFRSYDNGTEKKSYQDFFKGVHLNLVKNPLGRTISKNQKRYVHRVLELDALQPRQDLKKIIEEMR